MTLRPDATPTSLGIAAGLLSAACMSLSYLLSRHHALAQPEAERPDAAIGLLLRAHVVMGAVAGVLLAWLRPQTLPRPGECLVLLGITSGLYLLGNMLLFGMLRTVEASRLMPFLGLKVFMVALIVGLVMLQPLGATQWLAVALSVVATIILQGTAGGLPWRTLCRVLAVCLCFAVSDLFIVRLIDVLAAAGTAPEGRTGAAVLAMLMAYVTCGVVCGPVVLAGWFRPAGGAARQAWRIAAAYAAAWLLAMVGLYVSYSLVGVVFGNVVQSTRGVMSVVIGALLAHLGWHELEQRMDRGTLLRRVAAASLMTAAIALYVV